MSRLLAGLLNTFFRPLALYALLLLASALRVSAQDTGIADYDLASPADKIFAFDYEGTGKLNYLVCYRPGSGFIRIVRNYGGGVYASVFSSNGGIGGYDLGSTADRIFAFDYDGSGKLNYLVCYRPGSGPFWIIKNYSGGTFGAFYAGSGIAGYDLGSPSDRVFAFDYDGSGEQNYLICYRPAGGLWIIKNYGGNSFGAVYSSASIGGYAFGSPSDRVLAFDYEGNGSLNDLICYRPGERIIWVIKNYGGGTFGATYNSSTGIGGYDLASPDDQVFAFDYLGDGRRNHLVLYRPGSGVLHVLRSDGNGAFTTVFTSGSGIGGYDLGSTSDQLVAFDYDGDGKTNDLVAYRPGAGKIWVERNYGNGAFGAVYRSALSSFAPTTPVTEYLYLGGKIIVAQH